MSGAGANVFSSLRPGLWHAGCHSPVGVEAGLRLIGHVAFELCALPDGYLGIGLEGVFDALGLEEAGIYLPSPEV